MAEVGAKRGAGAIIDERQGQEKCQYGSVYEYIDERSAQCCGTRPMNVKINEGTGRRRRTIQSCHIYESRESRGGCFV